MVDSKRAKNRVRAKVHPQSRPQKYKKAKPGLLEASLFYIIALLKTKNPSSLLRAKKPQKRFFNK